MLACSHHLIRKEYSVHNDTIYELDTASDLEAWHTHEIHSHRRAPEYSFRRTLALCMAAAAVATTLTTSALPDSPGLPPQPAAAAAAPVEVAPPTPTVIADDRAALRAGRDQARKAEPPKPQPSKIEIVIAYALAQQGDRYRFGSAGPNTFDCSGLVLMAFKQVGISLPHFTGTMLSRGTRVSKAAMVRGDIVFLSDHHVALYIGNGMMVAASSGQGKVVVQKVYAFYTARRLL